VTADSKSFVALLAVLQIAGIALFYLSRVRSAFGTCAVVSLLVLLVIASTWSQIWWGEILVVVGEGLLALAAVGGVVGRIPLGTWWIVWGANLAVLLFLSYLAFFFHIF
jgi:hypothetical protein